MKKEEIENCKEISLAIIENVENAVKGHFGKAESGKFVKIGADGTPTSRIDLAAEDQVVSYLKNQDFICYLVSEEIGELKLGKGTSKEVHLTEELLNQNSQDAKYIFLCDPLDGTSNAIKNIPAFGISIAIAPVPKGRVATIEDVEIGTIKNFASGDICQAVKGQGALLNGKPLKPTEETDLEKISLGGFTKSNTGSVAKIVDTARRMRVLGSVVLELSYIASGKYDAFLDLRGSRIIDIAASQLIVKEAGAIVSNKYGEKLDNKLSIYEKAVIVGASNKELHDKLIKVINNNDLHEINSVAIISRIDENKSILYAIKIINILMERGIDISIETSLANKLQTLKNSPELSDIIEETKNEAPQIAKQLENINFNIDFKGLSTDFKDIKSDFAIILGGDGTLLRTQSLLTTEIPIFGINMGTVGFLTEIEVSETFKTLERILDGEYYHEKRSQIIVSHENHNYTALNEVVIMTDKPAKMLHFEITVDGEIVEELRADGLIISTPSGSTAYSMSAGGPIVDPKVRGFVIVPICPYKLGVRPFVVSDTSEIRVKLLKRGKSAIFVMDGQITEKVNYLEEIIFKKSQNDVTFIRTNNKYFYSKVKDKLGAGGINTEPRSI